MVFKESQVRGVSERPDPARALSSVAESRALGGAWNHGPVGPGGGKDKSGVEKTTNGMTGNTHYQGPGGHYSVQQNAMGHTVVYHAPGSADQQVSGGHGREEAHGIAHNAAAGHDEDRTSEDHVPGRKDANEKPASRSEHLQKTLGLSPAVAQKFENYEKMHGTQKMLAALKQHVSKTGKK